MKQELTPVQKKARLSIRRLKRDLEEMDVVRARMIERAKEWFFDEGVDEKGKPLISVKEKMSIFRAFNQATHVNTRAAEELGLVEKPQHVENHTHFTQINLTFDELQALPAPIREKLMSSQLAAARGEKVKAVDGIPEKKPYVPPAEAPVAP